MKCPSPPGAVPAANAAAAGDTRLPPAARRPPPASRLPPARARGRGCGRPAPARPLLRRPGRGTGAGRGAALCARAEERRAAGQAAEPGPGAGRGAPAQRRAALSAAPGRLHFVRGAGGGRGPRLGPPAGPLAAARPPGERPPPPGRPPAGAWRAAPLCLPGTPGAARRAGGVVRGPGPGAGRAGGMRAGGVRAARAGLTGRRRAVGPGSPRTFVGRKRGPREEGTDAVSPRSGFHVKNAAIWRLAVPGLAPKVEIGQRLDTFLDRCS
ncbi:nuclear transcription factor Y subunit beta isoform X1 [Equus asinus]|uniref:nuclear transcription factor Y subunit beta isoform X1 n=1 Tax=Equus asinus TaxID=9793 RepID=UPI0038F7AAAA